MEVPATKYDRLQEDQMQPGSVQPVITQPGPGGPPAYSGMEYPQQGYPAQGYPQQGYPPQVQALPQTSSTNVVVINQQPTLMVPGKRNWHSGMCACFDDMGTSLCKLKGMFGRIQELISEAGDCSLQLYCTAAHKEGHAYTEMYVSHDETPSPKWPCKGFRNNYIRFISLKDFLTCHHAKKGCCGLFCQYCLLYEITQKMGEDCCFCFCCPYAAMFGLRIKLRSEERIQGSLCNDYCAVMCCHPCVLCQLSRELKHLGR